MQTIKLKCQYCDHDWTYEIEDDETMGFISYLGTVIYRQDIRREFHKIIACPRCRKDKGVREVK